MKFASETRLFLEGSQVHLNGQKHIIRRKTYWLLDVAWKDRKMANWMIQNYPLAHWAAFNSGQHSVPKENKHGGRRILRCVPKLGYMLLENLHHPFSLISCLLLLLSQNREQLDPVESQKNYKSWRDDKRAEIPSPLYGSYLLFLYQGIFKTWANRFWYPLKYVNNIYLLLVFT